MKLLYTYLSFLLIAFTFAQTLDVNPITDELSIRDTSGATSEEIEVANYLQQLVVAAGLDSQNLTKRDYPDNSLLTAAFTSLNRSGVGVQLVHTFATSSATQGTTINTVGQYVSVTGLTKLLTSANKSGLAVSIVMRFLLTILWFLAYGMLLLPYGIMVLFLSVKEVFLIWWVVSLTVCSSPSLILLLPLLIPSQI